MPANVIEQVKTFIQRIDSQINTIESTLDGHPNQLTGELLIFKQLSYIASGMLRPDGRHVSPEITEEVRELTTRVRGQLTVARKCLDNGQYDRLYSELSILRHLATEAVGVMKNSPP